MTDLLSKFISVAKHFSHRSLLHEPIGTHVSFIKNEDSPGKCLFNFEDAILRSYASDSPKEDVLDHYFEGLRLRGIPHVIAYSCYSLSYDLDKTDLEFVGEELTKYLRKHGPDVSKHPNRIEVISLDYFEPDNEGQLIATISRKADDNFNIITTLSDFQPVPYRRGL